MSLRWPIKSSSSYKTGIKGKININLIFIDKSSEMLNIFHFVCTRSLYGVFLLYFFIHVLIFCEMMVVYMLFALAFTNELLMNAFIPCIIIVTSVKVICFITLHFLFVRFCYESWCSRNVELFLHTNRAKFLCFWF